MPPKAFINCPYCLYKTAMLTMAEGFSQPEMVAIFGDDGGKGLVPAHDSDKYLDYIEKLLIAKQAKIDRDRKAGHIADVEALL